MGKATGVTIGKVFGKAIPLLNIPILALDTYDTITGSMDLHNGPDEERALREKMKELEEEANKVVKTYNYYAEHTESMLPVTCLPCDRATLKLPLVDVPFSQ